MDGRLAVSLSEAELATIREALDARAEELGRLLRDPETGAVKHDNVDALSTVESLLANLPEEF